MTDIQTQGTWPKLLSQIQNTSLHHAMFFQLVHSTVFLSWTQLSIPKGQAYFMYHQQCLLFYSFLPSFTLTHLLLHPRGKNPTFQSYSILPKTPPSFTTHRLLLPYQPCICHLFLLTYKEKKSRAKKTSPQESSVFLQKRCCFRVLFRCQSSWQISMFRAPKWWWWAELNTNCAELSCTSSGSSQPCLHTAVPSPPERQLTTLNPDHILA